MRVEIEANDVFDLLDEVGIARQLESLDPMRLEVWARQIFRTVEGTSPTFAAIVRRLQWVAFDGVSCKVSSTTRLIVSALRGLRPAAEYRA